MIEAKEITLRRGGKTLLDQVSFRLQPGEVVMLLGPNGAGKTTLMRTLSGEPGHQQGTVTLDQHSMDRLPLEQLSLRRAIVSQSTHLGFPFSALDVVLMGVQTQKASPGRKLSLPRQTEIAEQALDIVEARHLAGRLYPQLSGGEQQRIQIARSLVQLWSSWQNQPQYLFLDEPTSALDLKYQVQVLRTLRELAKQQIGICCVIHDLQLAAQFADRLVIMKQGRIVAEGEPASLLSRGLIREIYEVESYLLAHPESGVPLAVVG